MVKGLRVRFRSNTPKAKLEQECESEFRKLVYMRGSCERCSKKDDTLQWAHIIPRGNKALKFDLLNAYLFCNDCHRWQEQNPLEFEAWIADKDLGRWEYLQEHKNDVVLRKEADYQELLEAIKKAQQGDLEAAKKLMVGDH